MGIDTTTEEILTLSQAARLVPHPGAKPPSTSTLWRWCRKGINGARLEYIRVGRRIFTSQAALSRFFAAGAKADSPVQGTGGSKPPVPAPEARASGSARRRAVAEAEAYLNETGI